MFKDNNKGRLSEELRTAISSLEASTATAAQRNATGVQRQGRREGGRGTEEEESETDEASN